MKKIEQFKKLNNIIKNETELIYDFYISKSYTKYDNGDLFPELFLTIFDNNSVPVFFKCINGKIIMHFFKLKFSNHGNYISLKEYCISLYRNSLKAERSIDSSLSYLIEYDYHEDEKYHIVYRSNDAETLEELSEELESNGWKNINILNDLDDDSIELLLECID